MTKKFSVSFGNLGKIEVNSLKELEEKIIEMAASGIEFLDYENVVVHSFVNGAQIVKINPYRLCMAKSLGK